MSSVNAARDSKEESESKQNTSVDQNSQRRSHHRVSRSLTRKIVTFSKTPPKLRLFWRDDAVIAPEPRKEDCITLKESMGISHLPGFFLGMAKSIQGAQTSKDLMLDRK